MKPFARALALLAGFVLIFPWVERWVIDYATWVMGLR